MSLKYDCCLVATRPRDGGRDPAVRLWKGAADLYLMVARIGMTIALQSNNVETHRKQSIWRTVAEAFRGTFRSKR